MTDCVCDFREIKSQGAAKEKRFDELRNVPLDSS